MCKFKCGVLGGEGLKLMGPEPDSRGPEAAAAPLPPIAGQDALLSTGSAMHRPVLPCLPLSGFSKL